MRAREVLGTVPWAVLLLCLAPGDARGQESPAPPSDWTFRLDALEEYRFRHATTMPVADPTEPPGTPPGTVAAEQDHDLRLSFDGGARNPRAGVSLDLSFALWVDLQGTPAVGVPVTAGMHERASRRFRLDVYALSGEWRGAGDRVTVRAGRQSAEFGTP